MRVLVTGASGFVGKHVMRELASSGHEGIGLDIGEAPAGLPAIRYLRGNITDAAFLADAVKELEPDACIHLAGLAFVGGGDVPRVMDINLMGSVAILEAFRLHRPRARILFVSSAQVYGMKSRSGPIREDAPLKPDSFYAIAKMAADKTTLLYSAQYGMDVMVARPHNHIGPGQSPQFAVPAFARQINAIRRGAPPRIRVGNLENRRDFSDVRDIAVAYRLLLERGHTGLAYNVASGGEIRIGDILETLCTIAGVHPEIVRDESLYRASDDNPLLDTSRLRVHTNWNPAIPLEQTLKDILAEA